MRFLRGEAVHAARSWGFGRIVVGGSSPLVEFIDGPICEVPGDELRILTNEAYEAELANRAAWERYLNWQVYGVDEPAVTALPHRFDLVTALRHELEFEWPRDSEPSWPSGFRFIAHDLNRPSVLDSVSSIASA